MGKKLLVLFILTAVLSATAFFAWPVLSQVPDLPPAGINKICLTTTANQVFLEEFIPTANEVVPFTASGLIPGLPAYIFMCGTRLDTTTGEEVKKCTSHNSGVDLLVLHEDNTDFKMNKCKIIDHACTDVMIDIFTEFYVYKNPVLNPNMLGEFRVINRLPQPMVVPASDTQSMYIEITIPQGHYTYDFQAIQLVPAPEPTGGVFPTISGENKSQQLSTLKQSWDVQFPPDSTIKKCASLHWDPYGTIFDAKSLEPIPDVEVRVLDTLSPEKLTDIIGNPQGTDYNGFFNFYVPEGTYYLRFNNVPPTHRFTAAPALHPNYDLIYSDLYKPDDPIHELIDTPEEKEKGYPKAEHRDVPMDPGANAPYKSDPKSITQSSGMDLFGMGDNARIKFEGKVSHPLTQIILVGQISGLEIARTYADNKGYWLMLVNPKYVPQDEPTTIKLKKTDLTGDIKSIVPLETEIITTSRLTRFEANDHEPIFYPILRVIDGYTYDSKGTIIPNATVRIKLNSNDQTYIETKSDSTGLVKIMTSDLPVFHFYIEVTDPKTGEKTTDQAYMFAQKNKQYLSKNRISLMGYDYGSDFKNKTSEKLAANGNDGQSGNNQVGKNDSPVASPTATTYQYKMIILVTVILALTIATAFLFIYIKTKRS